MVCEAADACARAIIRHCHSAKLLPRLCATAAGDKSGRLRQSAAELLMQVLEDWPPAAYERQVQELERAILAAVRDAQGETRAVGRTMYAAYARACPGPASALLLSLEKDKALQEKLAAAMRSYVPSAVAAGGASQPLSRAGSAAGSEQGSHCAAAVASLPRTGSGLSMGALRPPPPVPRLVLPPSSSGSSPSSCGASARGVASLPLWQQQRESENLPDNRHELAAAAAKPPIGRSAAASRRSMGGAALRVSLAQARDEMAQEEGTAAATAGASAAAAALGGRAGPRRVSVNPGAMRVVRPMPPFPSAPPSAVGSMSSLVDRLPSARSTSASLDRQASFAESGKRPLKECGGPLSPTRGWAPNMFAILAKTCL